MARGKVREKGLSFTDVIREDLLGERVEIKYAATGNLLQMFDVKKGVITGVGRGYITLEEGRWFKGTLLINPRWIVDIKAV